MRFVAIELEGGHTKLKKKGQDYSEKVQNCQLLLDSQAKNLEEFKEMLKDEWKGFEISWILILKVDESFKPVNYSVI